MVELVHNMKWSGREEDKAHKQAFLSSLLLHIYAELYVKGLVPNDLRWSYPSAMGYELMRQYNQIWQSLKHVTPVTNEEGTAWRLDIAQIPALNIKLGTDNVFGNTPAASSPLATRRRDLAVLRPLTLPQAGALAATHLARAMTHLPHQLPHQLRRALPTTHLPPRSPLPHNSRPKRLLCLRTTSLSSTSNPSTRPRP